MKRSVCTKERSILVGSGKPGHCLHEDAPCTQGCKPSDGCKAFGAVQCPRCGNPRDEHEEWDFRFCHLPPKCPSQGKT